MLKICITKQKYNFQAHTIEVLESFININSHSHSETGRFYKPTKAFIYL